jgi:hypothetical protein
MVVDDGNIDQEEDAETLRYLRQYTLEEEEEMSFVYGNEQGGDFVNEQGANDAGGAAADG